MKRVSSSIASHHIALRINIFFSLLHHQTEIGKKGGGGMLRKSFSKMGRMFNKKGSGAKPTLTHTAPEAYSRDAGGMISEGKSVRGNNGAGAGGGLTEEDIYGRRASDPSGIVASRAQSDGMILKNNYGRR